MTFEERNVVVYCKFVLLVFYLLYRKLIFRYTFWPEVWQYLSPPTHSKSEINKGGACQSR